MNNQSNFQIVGIEDGKKKNNTQYTCKEIESSNEQLQKMDSKKKDLKQKSSKRRPQKEEKKKERKLTFQKLSELDKGVFMPRTRVQAYLQSLK